MINHRPSPPQFKNTTSTCQNNCSRYFFFLRHATQKNTVRQKRFNFCTYEFSLEQYPLYYFVSTVFSIYYCIVQYYRIHPSESYNIVHHLHAVSVSMHCRYVILYNITICCRFFRCRKTSKRAIRHEKSSKQKPVESTAVDRVFKNCTHFSFKLGRVNMRHPSALLSGLLVVLLVARRFSSSSSSSTCSQHLQRRPRPAFHLTKECAASTMRTVASSNATGLDSCAELAVAKNAFAFAYANRTKGATAE